MIYFHRRNPLRVALQNNAGRFSLCTFCGGGEGFTPPPPFVCSSCAISPRPTLTETGRQPPRPARRPTNRADNRSAWDMSASTASSFISSRRAACSSSSSSGDRYQDYRFRIAKRANAPVAVVRVVPAHRAGGTDVADEVRVRRVTRPRGQVPAPFVHGRGDLPMILRQSASDRKAILSVAVP